MVDRSRPEHRTSWLRPWSSMEPRHFVACASFKTSGSRIFLAFTRPDDELDANDQSRGEEIDVFHVDARRWSRELISEASSDSTYKAAMEDCIYFFNRELLLYQLNTSGMTYVRLPAAKDDESWPRVITRKCFVSVTSFWPLPMRMCIKWMYSTWRKVRYCAIYKATMI